MQIATTTEALMRNSQGFYEPGQEAHSLPGPEAYDAKGRLRHHLAERQPAPGYGLKWVP